MSGAEVRDYFDRIAPEWDRLRQGYFADAVRDEVVRQAQPRSDMQVVDVGCGTGFLAAAFAPLVAEVNCVDASPGMLDQAHERLRGHENVRFHLAEGTSIPLPDGSVDLAVANMYLHHTPDPGLAVREMARILRPGGRLLLTDIDEHDEEWMRAEMADVWLGFPRVVAREWLVTAGLEEASVEDCGHR